MTSAAEIFVEKGFDAATMTEIAARAGAAIGTLYLYFPTKEALARAVVVAHGEDLTQRLDALREEVGHRPADEIADALFAMLGDFLTSHPAYSTLLDLSGADDWRRALRARRRQQIMALFAQARPRLTEGQAERLAVIVPQLMRIPFALASEDALRSSVIVELRLMLSRHLRETS